MSLVDLKQLTGVNSRAAVILATWLAVELRDPSENVGYHFGVHCREAKTFLAEIIKRGANVNQDLPINNKLLSPLAVEVTICDLKQSSFVS